MAYTQAGGVCSRPLSERVQNCFEACSLLAADPIVLRVLWNVAPLADRLAVYICIYIYMWGVFVSECTGDMWASTRFNYCLQWGCDRHRQLAEEKKGRSRHYGPIQTQPRAMSAPRLIVRIPASTVQ